MKRIRNFVRNRFRRKEVRAARLAWSRHEQRLKSEFLAASGASGPVQWSGESRFARDRDGGRLVGLVGLTVSRRLIASFGEEDGPPERETPTFPQEATAVFYFCKSWTSDGRLLLNLSPDEVLDRLSSLEPAEESSSENDYGSLRS